ncbi:MAG: HepT-like ribonuclease domain-containing protein [Planctomycetota bacterium]
MKGDRFCLIHMNECIRRVAHYVTGGRGAFMGSTLIQDAVLWNLQLISAAAMRLSAGQKQMHPEVDWGHIANVFREVAHDPWQVDQNQIWRCAEVELPSLKQHVDSILRPATGRF